MSDRVSIRKLPSGVPGLDDVLGGGIPGVLLQPDRRRPGVRQDDAGASDHVREREPRAEGRVLQHHRRTSDQDASLPAAVRVLRRRQGGRRLDSLHPPRPAGARREGWRRCWKPSCRRSRRRSPANRRRGLLSSHGAKHARRRAGRRARADGLHAAPRAHAHELRGHHLPHRGVCRRRARQRGVHGGRRAPLALPGRRAQLRRAQAARGEDARPGADPRTAHGPHHGRGLQRLPATSQAGGGHRRAPARTSRSRPACRASTR